LEEQPKLQVHKYKVKRQISCGGLFFGKEKNENKKE